MRGLDRKKKQLADERKERAGRRRMLSLMAALVIVATAVALMAPAISMTRGELVCGLEEHQHSDACYEQVLVCGYGDGEDGGAAVVDAAGDVQAHVHTEACYERRLACEIPEHVHSSACYAEPAGESGEQADLEAQEVADGDDGASAVESDVAEGDASESNDEAAEKQAGQGGSGDVAVEDGSTNDSADSGAGDSAVGAQGEGPSVDERGESEKQGESTNAGESEVPGEAPMPAQSLAAEADLGDGKVLRVSAECDEGVLPEGTTMRLTGLAEEKADGVIELVKREAEAQAGIPADACGVTAADVEFLDASGAVVKPQGSVAMKIEHPGIEDGASFALLNVVYADIEESSDEAALEAQGEVADAEADIEVQEGATPEAESDLEAQGEAAGSEVDLEAEEGAALEAESDLETQSEASGAETDSEVQDAAPDAGSDPEAQGEAVDDEVDLATQDVATTEEDLERKDEAFIVESDAVDLEEHTVELKAASPGTYALAVVPPADDEQAGSQDGAEPVKMPAVSFSEKVKAADGSIVTVSVDADEGTFPEGVTMKVKFVTDDNVIDAAKAEAADELGTEAERTRALAVDITFFDAEDNPIEPAGDVRVTMTASAVAEQDQLAVVHVDDETNAQVVQGEDVNKAEQTVAFDATNFSVYALVYTVDFHWEVDGKVYEFSLPGGGFVSFRALMEVLGVAKQNASAANQPEGSTNTDSSDSVDGANGADGADAAVSQASDPQVLNGIQVSEETTKLVADVAKVEFSNPDLLWVSKAEADTTVGSLKETNELDCQYSAELTDEQKKEIDEQQVVAGDWALISLKPFLSQETLTVTMKNGDQFVVKVTDAQVGNELNGKSFVIKTVNNPVYAMSSSPVSWDHYQSFLQGQIASGADSQIWVFEYDGSYGNRYRIKSASTGTYLTIGSNDYSSSGNYNASLSSSPALFYIDNQNGTYSVSTYYNGGTLRYLNFADNYDTPRFLFGNNEQRFTFEEAQLYEPAGDWLLYFDDDFSNKEITIHVGETITLRPYNKWEWKENGEDVQTAHWNVGTWNDWSISSSDGNGSKQSKTTDGPFEFTRYVKYDDQLVTHYWSVQGRATKTGTYTLTNTKNNKTITVHVVDDPVDHPKTINKIANIKVNLFDYDKYGTLDGSWNNNDQWWNDDNHANDSGYKNVSVNSMGGSDHFYFLSSGGGDQWGESWNDYTHDDPNPNIVKNKLDSDGYPVLNHGQNTSLKYLFDKTKTSWNGGNNDDPDGMICYPDVVGMFQKDPETGYYYFNSNTNYYYYDTETGSSNLYEHTYTQTSSRDKNSLVNDKPIGFFPFHEYDSTNNLSVNQNHNLNHHVGMSMDIEFMLSEDRKDDRGQPIIFDFSGDDDLWVFVEWEEGGVKHSQLLLDLGGVHQPIHGEIDFTNGDNTAFIQPNRPYTLKVFYLERGGCDSNCSIRFNLPIIQDLAIAKKLTGLTETEKAKYKDEVFWYELVIDHKPYGEPVPYTCPNDYNPYEKATIWDADGNDVTPPGFAIQNGRFSLKDGQTLTISYLDRSDKFYVAELNTANMENFEVPNAERFYHQAHDASLYEEEITLTACKTIAEAVQKTDCWSTPRESEEQYELEDTEKVTFTNTLKEKNLEVEKKWIGNQAPPESITFTVSAMVDDGTGGRTPYVVEELTNSNGTAKEFTLNAGNDWRHEIEHLPVNTPDGKFIFYDIRESQVEGYVLTGIEDLTANHYNYCNIDVVKLWPDSNGTHTEVLQVVLKNSAGKYYAGVDEETGKAKFVDNPDEAEKRPLNPGNNYSQRFARLPYGDYTAEQLHEDEYNHGLATYKRAIIQYELENSPLESPVNPKDKPNEPVIHKRIDALRDGVTNPDSVHTGEDLTDLYRLYLDYKINALQDPNGVDLLLVIDHSGSMNDSHWPGNEYRASSVMAALNGENGFISKFLAANDKNQWAAVGFKGPDGFRDYEFSLENPWLPKEDDSASTTNAGQNGSEVLSPGGDSYGFSKQVANVLLPANDPLILSNYTAGFWRAEQFLLKQDVMNDGRKKVVVFIADGVPTLHINGLNGSLADAGTAAGSPYYREEYGGCPEQALTEFGYFIDDLTSTTNGYSFGGDTGNIELYTIGLGALMQTDGSSDSDAPLSGSELLREMLKRAYGDNVPDDHYMTITDPASSEDQAAATKLNGDLGIILGVNHTFSDLVIQDDLSKYVDLCGLTEQNVMTAAKAMVTMTVPDFEHPENPPAVITLYENGAPVDSDAAKFTMADGVTKETIIDRLQYDESSKTVKAVFNPAYQPVGDVTYTLSFDVKATDTAYTTYAASGYDKYTSGDEQGPVIVGDEDTDFLGTDPANATSVSKPGFRSNDEAKATYKHNGNNEEKVYPHPVIQVAAKADIVKVDENGAALEGAKFNLYDYRYDASKTIAENADYLIKENLESKKPTDPAGDDAVIRSGKLGVGTYYLVETEAPAGYNSLSGPVKITITETSGILSMKAEIAGESIGSDKLVKIDYGHWKLSVQNTAGYELPHTGGIGTNLFTLFGTMLIILAGARLAWVRIKRRTAA